MIAELQRCPANYEEMLTLLLRHLFILIHRRISKPRVLKDEYLDNEMDLAAQYFNDHYHLDIQIEDYAASRGMSVSWFIRSFKQYTHTTPMQYLVSRRITNAQMLLETTNYNITEIGQLVGYDNPLYFSRIFRKQKGMSPSEYRKLGQAGKGVSKKYLPPRFMAVSSLSRPRCEHLPSSKQIASRRLCHACYLL